MGFIVVPHSNRATEFTFIFYEILAMNLAIIKRSRATTRAYQLIMFYLRIYFMELTLITFHASIIRLLTFKALIECI